MWIQTSRLWLSVSDIRQKAERMVKDIPYVWLAVSETFSEQVVVVATSQALWKRIIIAITRDISVSVEDVGQ